MKTKHLTTIEMMEKTDHLIEIITSTETLIMVKIDLIRIEIQTLDLIEMETKKVEETLEIIEILMDSEIDHKVDLIETIITDLIKTETEIETSIIITKNLIIEDQEQELMQKKI